MKILGTRHWCIIDAKIKVCSLIQSYDTNFFSAPISVFLASVALKHVYDKRPAQEFDLILQNLVKILTKPDAIYKNKINKRGNFCFCKTISQNKYICLVELVDYRSKFEFQIVTFFRVEDKYLKTYEIIWRWKGGTPS